jgi:hypothetical protein
MGILFALMLMAHGTLARAAPETILGPTGVPLERLYNISFQLPGTTEPVTLEGLPVPCGAGVVFRAKEFSAIKSWAYLATATSFQVVVDEETLIPGTSEVFFELDDIQCIAGGEYSFLGSGNPASELHSSAYTWLPGRNITLLQPSGVAVDGHDVRSWVQLNVTENGAALLGHRDPLFLGEMIGLKPPGQDAIYVADQSQSLPGQTQPVSNFDSPRMLGSSFVFRALSPPLASGLYRWSQAGGFSALADTGTPVPGFPGTFTAIGKIAVLADGVAFSAGFSSGLGIFLVDERGEIEPFVLPGATTVGGETLLAAFLPYGAGHFMAFRGVTDATAPREGVFARTPEGLIYRIVSEGDMLDGQHATEIFINADDRSVAIRVDTHIPTFDQNIYRVTFVSPAIDIPALSSGGRLVLVASIALLALWTIWRKLRAAPGSDGLA